LSGTSLVLGVGNRHRGDDAVGLLVLDHLRELAPAGVRLEQLQGAPMELCAWWSADDRVVLVDAARSGLPAGRIQRFDARAAPLPAESFSLSTHSLGVVQGVELARVMGRLPARLVVYGIEGQRFDPGAPPTPAVQAAVAEAGQRVLEELGLGGGDA
jgi:hydrogenase maturation protease